MAKVVPTVTANSAHEYNEQFGRVASLSDRLGLDFIDGKFANTHSINLIQAHWPPDKTIDLHLMYRQPQQQLETIISLNPSLAVLHAEAMGDKTPLFKQLQAVGIKAGLALLPESEPSTYADLIKQADHVLIFSGHLGHFGGQADLALLHKVPLTRAIKPEVEISWDGGVSDQNIDQLVRGGVDVLYVGGFIQQSADPQTAYATLKTIAERQT